MKGYKYSVFLSCAFLSLTSCFTTAKRSPLTFVNLMKPKGGEVHYIDGKEIVVSTKKKSIVSFGLKDGGIYDEDKAKMYLFFQFKNLSSKPVTISVKNVSVTRKEDNKTLRVLDYSSLEWDAIRIELDAGTHQRMYGNIPSIAEELFVLEWKKAHDPLKKSILRKNTLQPNESVKGVVIIETYKLTPGINKNYIITVNLLKETHTFHLLRKPGSLKSTY